MKIFHLGGYTEGIEAHEKMFTSLAIGSLQVKGNAN